MEAKIRVYAKAQNGTALGIANAYVKLNPNATLQDLNNAFPISLNSSNRSETIFVDVNDKSKFITVKEGNSNFELFFFEKDDEVITLKDGQKVVMLELWVKESFLKIVEHAKQFGIIVAESKPATPFEKGGFLLEELKPVVIPEPVIAPKIPEAVPPKKNNMYMIISIIGVIALIIIILATQCNSSDEEKQPAVSGNTIEQVVTSVVTADKEISTTIDFELVINPTKANGKSWDTQGKSPDPIIKISIDGNEMVELGPTEDVLTTAHNVALTLPAKFETITFHVIDNDHLNHDEIGFAYFKFKDIGNIEFNKEYSLPTEGEIQSFKLVFINNQSDEIDEPVQTNEDFTPEFVETTIKRIKEVFAVTQANVSKYEVVNKESGNVKLKAYIENGKVRLIRADESGKATENYYYENNQFIFMYNDGKDVNRYYFSGEKMIRWLDPAKKMMDANSAEFIDNQNQFYAKGITYFNLINKSF